MKLEKLEKTSFKKVVEIFEQHMYRGLIMTMLLVTSLSFVPKSWFMFVYFAIFINIVMIAYVVATFKQDITYKSILDAVEISKNITKYNKTNKTDSNTTKTDKTEI